MKSNFKIWICKILYNKKTIKNNLPKVVELKNLLHMYDQGELGSSTDCAGASAYQYVLKHKSKSPNKLFIYYKEKRIENGNNNH